MSSKCYIDRDNITFDTEVEWGLNRCGRVVELATGQTESFYCSVD